MFGVSKVGKSALIVRYLKNKFGTLDSAIEDSYDRIVELNPLNEDIDAFRVSDHSIQYQYVTLGILDTIYQDNMSGLQNQWIRESNIILLCFAINSIKSFESAQNLKKRILRLKESWEGLKGFAIILVGTKGDLRYSKDYDKYKKDIIDIDIILKTAKSMNLPYIETSAKLGINVNFLYRQCVYEYWIQSKHYDFR